MDSFSNEMIFYAGSIIAGTSAMLSIIYAIVHYIGYRRLNSKFDIEYGKTYKKKG